MACYRAKGRACAAGVCSDVDLLAKKTGDSQLTILSGTISDAPVVPNQTFNLSNIGGSLPWGVKGGDRTVKCKNNKDGQPPENCRCLNVTGFGVDSLQNPQWLGAVGWDECPFIHVGGFWTNNIPVTKAECPRM